MCAWDETDRHPCSPHKGAQHAAVAALGIYSKGVGDLKHGRMGTLQLRGAERLICPKFYASFYFFLLCPDFPHCFARIWEGSCPPASYAYDLKIMIILGMSNIVFIAFSVI